MIYYIINNFCACTIYPPIKHVLIRHYDESVKSTWFGCVRCDVNVTSHWLIMTFSYKLRMKHSSH